MRKLFALVLLAAVATPPLRLTAQETAIDVDPAAGDASSDPDNLLKPPSDDAWVFQVNGGAEGVKAVIDDALVFVVTKITGTNWHVQAFQAGLDLKDDKEYVLKFQAKSPEAVPLLVVAQINEEDWHEAGLHEEVTLEKEYRDYEYTFEAAEVVPNNTRIGFLIGAAKGVVYIKDPRLIEKE